MICKRIAFVVDKKGEDILAPMFVPSHAYAVRQYLSFADTDDIPMYARYPEDYILVSGLICYEGDDWLINTIVTPFSDFITKVKKDV